MLTWSRFGNTHSVAFRHPADARRRRTSGAGRRCHAAVNTMWPRRGRRRVAICDPERRRIRPRAADDEVSPPSMSSASERAGHPRLSPQAPSHDAVDAVRGDDDRRPAKLRPPRAVRTMRSASLRTWTTSTPVTSSAPASTASATSSASNSTRRIISAAGTSDSISAECPRLVVLRAAGATPCGHDPPQLSFEMGKAGATPGC